MIEFIIKILGNTYIMGFLTVFGTILAIYGILAAWRFRRVSYRRHDNVWKNAEKHFDELQIVAKEAVSEIYIARFAIWNSGTKYINDFDMAPKGPLRITTKDNAKVIDARVITVTDEYNNIQCIKEDEKNVLVTFDF